MHKLEKMELTKGIKTDNRYEKNWFGSGNRLHCRFYPSRAGFLVRVPILSVLGLPF